MRKRGHRSARRAAMLIAAAALFSLLPGSVAAGDYAQSTCWEPYSFTSTSIADPCGGTTSYDWDVDPPYDGGYYASESEAAAAEQQQGTVQVTVTLPTWRNVYDWPAGHGYVGVQSATSSTSLYATQSNLGGNYGLWLWPRGGQYGPGFAEWTYTAPGTTRIAKAELSYAYRNKLLAHHCVRTGLRTAGAIGAILEHCKPVSPPDSQRDVTTTLADPAASPTSKQLFFGVEFPQCADPASPSCTKNIPALDPLANGGYARLKRVDLTLVDDDLPVVTPSGPLWDLAGTRVGGGTHEVTLTATDAGAGVKRVWLEREGAGEITGQATVCDPEHNTPALDARICPASATLMTSVDLGALPEGTTWFVAKAADVAGNVGSTRWAVTIDPSRPVDEYGYEASWENDEPGLGGSDDVPGGGGDGYDPDLDPDNACDAYVDLGFANACLATEVHTDPATNVGGDTATLNGRVHPHGFAATYYFEWQSGADTGTTPEREIDEGWDAEVAVRETLGGLAAGVEYAFRLAARGEGGSPVYGEWVIFRTTGACQSGGCSAVASPPTVVSSSNSGSTQMQTAVVTASDPSDPSGYNGCGVKAVFWSVGSPTKLIAAVKSHALGVLCGDYYFAQERAERFGLDPQCFKDERTSWPANFHAAPVFNWNAWANWKQVNNKTWFDAGVEFRKRTVDAGCQDGDKWFLNELHSDWFGFRFSEATRKAARARIVSALRGLYEGGTLPDVTGFPADVARQHNLPEPGFTQYRTSLPKAYQAKNFWRSVRRYTEGWSKEVYNRCAQVCTGDAVATIANNGVNNYSYHQRFLALAAPDTSTDTYAPVKTTLGEDYSPLMNAIFNSSLEVYGSRITLGQMTRLIRQQVYSARLAAEFRYGSAGRIGFAWKESDLYSFADPRFDCNDGPSNECERARALAATAKAAEQMAANLAAAIRNAYVPNALPLAACRDDDGTGPLYVGCRPSRTGADYYPAWNRFKSW